MDAAASGESLLRELKPLSLPKSPTTPYARFIAPDLYVWMTVFYAS